MSKYPTKEHADRRAYATGDKMMTSIIEQTKCKVLDVRLAAAGTASEPGPRGRRVIVVNGEPWGYINMKSHGPGGNSFWFEQRGEPGEIICEPPKTPREKFRDRGTEISVPGDKIAERRRRSGEPLLKPLGDRLLDKTRDLIDRKLLRHPDAVRAQHEREQQRYREHATREQQKARERDMLRAHDVISKFAGYLRRLCQRDRRSHREGEVRMTMISHDAFARTSIYREQVEPPGTCCAWCGGLNRYNKLFQYYVVADDSLRGRKHPIPGLFCSASCRKSYHRE